MLAANMPKLVKLCMTCMLRRIDFLGHQISKNEIVSMELLSFLNKTTRKEVILVMGVTARKRSENECLLQICLNLFKLCMTS